MVLPGLFPTRFSERSDVLAEGRPRCRRLLFVLLPLCAAAAALLFFADPAAAAPLSLANADMDKVCVVSAATGTFSDRTTEANSAVVNDVILGNTALNTGNTYVYFGMNEVFKTLVLDVGTAGVTGTLNWEYYRSSGWTALTVTDASNHFRTAGVNTAAFTPPDDWAETTADALCSGTYYFVRASTNAVYTVLPLLDQASTVEYNYKFKVQDGFSVNFTGLTVDHVAVQAGTINTIFAFREIGDGVYEVALDMGGLDHAFTLRVVKDGYVTGTNYGTGTLTTTMTDGTSLVRFLNHGVRLTIDTELTGRQTLTGATVTTGDSYAVACAEPPTPTGDYYCAVPVAHTATDVRVVKDGYVQLTLAGAWRDRTSPDDPQVRGPLRAEVISGLLPAGLHSAATAWTGSEAYLFGGCSGTSTCSVSAQIARYRPTTNAMDVLTAVLPTARQHASAVWTGTYVFVFGGQDTTSATSEIVRYDPATDKVAVMAATLPQGRGQMAAVWTGTYAYLLGGTDGTVGYTSILRYDPAADSLTTMSGTLPQSHWRRAAAWDGTYAWLLGGTDGTASNAIVRYDPAADSAATQAATLPSARSAMGSAWDGTYIYLFGGTDGTTATSDILRYTPGATSVTKMGAWLPSARSGTGAVWDGSSKAYIIGGQDTIPINQVVVYSPSAAHPVTTMTGALPAARAQTWAVWSGTYFYLVGGNSDQVLRYNPATDTATTMAGTLPSARDKVSAVWSGTYVYIFGGSVSGGQTSEIVRYDPGADSATVVANFASARDNTGACYVNNKAYVFGGWAGLQTTASIVEFNPSDNAVTTKSATLPTGRTAMSVATDGTYCYLFGGWNAVQLSQILKYDPASDTLSTMSATLPTARDGTSAVWGGAVAYVFGGFDGTKLQQIVQYDPAADTATTLEEKLPEAMDKSSAASDGSNAYVFGGSLASSNTDDIVRYDADAIAVRIAGTVPTGRAYGAVVWDGTYAYHFGGKTSSTARTDEILRYDPATRTIRTMKARLPSARSYVSAIWDSRDRPNDGCPNGCAYVFGGLTTISLADIVRYNPTRDELTLLGVALPSARDGTSAIFDGTHAYIFGGGFTTLNSMTRLADIVKFDPVALSASTLSATLPTGRHDTSAIWSGTYGYIYGGYDGGYLTSVLRFYPTDGTITTLSETLPSGRYWTAATWDGTYGWIFGGQTSTFISNDILRHNPSTGAIENMEDTFPLSDFLPVSLNGPAAFYANNKHYTLAGYTGSYRTDVIEYNPSPHLDLQYAFKVTGVTTERSASLASVTVQAGDDGGDAGTEPDTACTESGGAWYCAVPLADTALAVHAAKDGYVTNTATSFASDRTAHSDAQKTVAVTNVLYSLKVTITNEATLTGVSFEKKIGAGSYAAATPTATNGNVSYWAQSTSESSLVFRALKGTNAGDTGTAFSVAATSQTAKTITLEACSSDCPMASPSASASSLVAGATTTYTFSFQMPNTWPLDAKLQVVFPSGYSIGATAATISGATGIGSVGVSGQTVTVTRSGGADTAASTTVSVALTQITNPTVSGSSGSFALTTVDAAGTTTLATGTAAALTITSGSLSSLTSSAASTTAGATTSYTFGLTLANPWPSDGKATFTFPSGYTLGSPAVTLTGADGSASASVSGQVVTVARSGGTQTAAGTAVTVALSQVTNPGVSGSSGTFALASLTAASVSIDAGTAPALTITAGALGTLTTSGASLTAGASTTYTFGFTNANAWGINGRLVVDFPTGYSIGSASITLGGADGSASVLVSGRTVTVIRSSDGTETAAGTSVTVAVTAVTNPTAAGATGTFSLEMENGAAVDIDTGTAPAVTVTAAALSTITVSPSSASLVVAADQTFTASGADAYGNGVSVSPTWSASCGSITSGGVYTAPNTAGSCTATATSGSVSGTASVTVSTGSLTSLTTTAGSLTSGGNTTYTLGFTLANPWAATGKVVATFPSGYSFGNTPAATLTGASGTATVSVSGQAVTVTRANDGSATSAGAAVTVALTQVHNAQAAGSSGTFAVSVQNAAGTTIDSGSAPAVTLVAGSLASIAVSPASPSLAVGASQTFTAAGSDAYGNTVSVSPAWSAGCGSITGAGAYTAPSTAGSCSVTATSGSVSGSTTATVTAASLSSLSTTAGNLTRGYATQYTFGFTTSSAWPADGRLVVTFPSGYAVGAAPTLTLTGADGAGSAAVSSRTVTITRSDGTATAAGTAVTVKVTSITNPTDDGATSTFSLSLETSAGGVLDSGSAPSVTIASTILSVRNLASSSHPSGTWVASSTLAASWDAPTEPAIEGYSWGVDADPDSVVDGSGRSATISGLADGVHSFRVKAKSTSGVWGPVATYGDVRVDTTAPGAPVIVSGSHGSTGCGSSSTGTFTWSASDATSGLHATEPYAYSLDGAAFTKTASSGASLANLADGSHTLTVRAVDQASHSKEAAHAFKVDRTAPAVTLSAAAYSASSSLAVAWAASDGCSTVSTVEMESRFAGGSWTAAATQASASGTWTFNAALGDGLYEFRARATDAVGNTGAWPGAALASTVLDRVSPGAPGGAVASAAPGGTFRVSWTAATDDRSGVAGYDVYRVGADGGLTKVTSALVTALEFLDGPHADGTRLQFVAKAVDRAGNVGPASAASTEASSDASAPGAAPGGLTAEGIQGDILPRPDVRLLWQAVEGAAGYRVYAGPGPGFDLSEATRVGTPTGTTFEVPHASDGWHHYVVVAVDEAGNEGPPATLSFLRDSQAPVSAASAPAESGPAVVVRWTSRDDGLGVERVELWVVEDHENPRLFFAAAKAEGSVSFYGIEGHTYHFVAVATDGYGRVEAKGLDAAGADASTRIVASVVTAHGEALAVVAGAGGGGGLAKAFYAEDADKDGFPEAFVDPNGLLAPMQVVPVNGTDHAFLLGTASSGGEDPLALWSPATGHAVRVEVRVPVEAPSVVDGDNGRRITTFRIDKPEGWIFVVVDDEQPEWGIEGVFRSDGSRLPNGYYWRANDKVFLIDDPSYEYRVVYVPPDVSGTSTWLVAFLSVALLVSLAAAWVAWPSPARLGRHPIPPRSLRWALRHCGACGRPLARLHRLARPLHECGSLARRVAAEHGWWKRAALGAKLSRWRAALGNHGWLFKPRPSSAAATTDRRVVPGEQPRPQAPHLSPPPRVARRGHEYVAILHRAAPPSPRPGLSERLRRRR